MQWMTPLHIIEVLKQNITKIYILCTCMDTLNTNKTNASLKIIVTDMSYIRFMSIMTNTSGLHSYFCICDTYIFQQHPERNRKTWCFFNESLFSNAKITVNQFFSNVFGGKRGGTGSTKNIRLLSIKMCFFFFDLVVGYYDKQKLHISVCFFNAST